MARLLMAGIFALFLCASALAGPHLTRSQAIRIVDTKAKSSGDDLRDYHCGPVNHEASEDAWWVNYRQKHAKYTQFSIRVEDKTKKACWFFRDDTQTI